MAVSLLEREIYSYGDVDRLVGLTPGTAKRWLNGYSRGGADYAPILREQPRSEDVVTWGEMVEARLLAEYRAKRVAVRHMRPAIERLRSEFGPYPLAHARPFLEVEGHELVMQIQHEVGLADPLQLVVVRNNQLMLSDAVARFRASVDYDQAGSATSIVPQPRTPNILLDPTRSFGQPVIRGRAVQTSTIAEDYRAGASIGEIADLYDLTSEQVDEALRYELITTSQSAA
ncbi:MAG: DUF433 domain-containing protein [Nocardioidaceae bacterium]